MTVAGRRAHWHSGSIPGFRSALMYLIDEGIGVSVLANRSDVYPSQIAVAAIELLTGAPPTTATRPVPADHAEQARDKIIGRWHDQDRDVFVDVQPGPDGSIECLDEGETFRFMLATMAAGKGPLAPRASYTACRAITCDALRRWGRRSTVSTFGSLMTRALNSRRLGRTSATNLRRTQ
jgi:hypothetical protein